MVRRYEPRDARHSSDALHESSPRDGYPSRSALLAAVRVRVAAHGTVLGRGEGSRPDWGTGSRALSCRASWWSRCAMSRAAASPRTDTTFTRQARIHHFLRIIHTQWVIYLPPRGRSMEGGFLPLWLPWQVRAFALSFLHWGGRPPQPPYQRMPRATSSAWRSGEFRGPAAGVVEESIQLDRDAADVFDGLVRHVQVPLARLELTSRSGA